MYKMKSAGWRLTTDRWALVVLFIVASCVILSSLSRSMLQFAAPPVHHLSAFMYDDSHRHMQIMETQQVNIRLPYERGDGMKELSVQRFKQFLLTLRLVLMLPRSRFFCCLESLKWSQNSSWSPGGRRGSRFEGRRCAITLMKSFSQKRSCIHSLTSRKLFENGFYKRRVE